MAYKYTKDVQLSNGSIICWSRRTQKKVPVQCGTCGKERLLYIQNVTVERFTGVCYECSKVAARTHTDVEVLESGSVVYWNERQGIGRDQAIPVKRGVCGAIRKVAAHKVPKSNFTGFCMGCARTGQRSVLWKGGRFKHPSGYILRRLTPEDKFYSMADSHHLVPEHRLVMAEHVGRCLRDNEIVHHKNGIKDDNRLENLELLDWRLHHKGFNAPEFQPEELAVELMNIFKSMIRTIFRTRNK